MYVTLCMCVLQQLDVGNATEETYTNAFHVCKVCFVNRLSDVQLYLLSAITYYMVNLIKSHLRSSRLNASRDQ